MKAGRALLLQLFALKANEAKENEDDEGEVEAESSSSKSHLVRFGEANYEGDDLVSEDDQSSCLSMAEKKGEVDIDIETTLSRNTMYQMGSQALGISNDPAFLEQEAELTSEVTNRIETRVNFATIMTYRYVVLD